jgi:hypothetical protein
MKKGNVLQYALIITGIILAYNALQSLLLSILYIGVWFTEDGARGDSRYFPSLINYLYLALQFLAAWWLIIKSGAIAAYIEEKAGAAGGITITGSSTGLLQVVLVATGVYFIILNITYIINFLIDEYRNRNQFQPDGKSPFVASLLIKFATILPAVIVAVYAGQIAAYFTKKADLETITIEQDIEDIKDGETGTPQ